MKKSSSDYLEAVRASRTCEDAKAIIAEWAMCLRGRRKCATVCRALGWQTGALSLLESGENLMGDLRAKKLDVYYECGGLLRVAMRAAREMRYAELAWDSSKAHGDEPTMADLDAMIARQLPTMPDGVGKDGREFVRPEVYVPRIFAVKGKLRDALQAKNRRTCWFL